MNKLTHDQIVLRQFGEQAQAYLHSAVHSAGPELAELAEAVTQIPQARVLDLGCGGGHVSFQVAPLAEFVVAYDLSQAMLDAVAASAAAQKLGNIHVRQGAAEQLPFADESFDFVFSRYSAHHWYDPLQALREVRRVLKPGGRVAFVDVASPGMALLDTYLQAVELLRDTSHVRDYSAAEWCDMFGSAGLVVSGYRMQKLHLEFGSWVERMRTPDVMANAIRKLQQDVSADVKSYFEIEGDGSFTTDVIVLWAVVDPCSPDAEALAERDYE
ncbi:methyltransferase domain-containing protein [Pseudomonas sp. gcc21]|uniref:class I SAM-dependent methyltransferase n=1 Tax=Pseudomonas sp. gcc21 TaxID=2726989 RepID=UPI0014511571|nr:class I SAM-dependent methyltransferase [Pseudomonas sp. gcc21]QJD58092.1 methyltransferase domain-containing protein [Pseudomonas sp. gcc21]